MRSNSKRNKGFTLIELLIVILIIGVLATLVLFATDSARGKGKDASTKNNLEAIRTQAQIFHLDNGNYLPNNTLPIGRTTPCSTAIGWNAFFSDPVIFASLGQINKHAQNSATRCANNINSWLVAVRLNSATTGSPKSWCADSSGNFAVYNVGPGNVIAADQRFNPWIFFCSANGAGGDILP